MKGNWNEWLTNQRGKKLWISHATGVLSFIFETIILLMLYFTKDFIGGLKCKSKGLSEGGNLT